MRASTLVGLAIALFLGAVAVVAVKSSGWLERTPAILAKEEPVMVLVAKSNMFEGTTVSSDQVELRPASAREKEMIEREKDKLMPASVQAVDFRIAARNITVGELILRDHFIELSIPDSPTKRLAPGMRSVNVVVPKDRAASGLLRIGEHVDVYLTTTICTDPKCTSPRTATAPLATNLKIIIKRDSLWTMMAPVPEDQPVSYVLEANPYRAALIELAKTKGSLTLVPTTNHVNVKNVGLNSPMDDSARVAAFLSGEATVTEQDLERIFNVKPAQTPEPPLAIEHYKGVEYVGTTIMDKTYGRSSNVGNGAIGFYAPQANASLNPTADCPTCGKNKK